MKLVFILLGFFLIHSIAMAQLAASGPAPSSKYPGPELRYYFEMPKIVRSITELRQLGEFPVLNSTFLVQPPRFAYSDKKDPLAESILQRLNRTAFKNSDLSVLKFCIGCETAKLWAESMIVIFDPEFFTKAAESLSCGNKASLYAFVLAHELGHYLHELHISRHGKSPHGLGSCFFVPAGAQTREQKIENEKAYGWKHAEVDLYAMALTKALGYDLDCAEKFLSRYESISNDSESFIDSSIRWRSMQYIRYVNK